MKLKLLYYVVISFILCCCMHRNNKQVEKQTFNDNIKFISKNKSSFDPIIVKAIEETIQYIEGKNIFQEEKVVYGLHFFKEKKDAFLGTSAQPLFYIKEQIIGYTYFNNRMIVYYGDTTLGNEYIDIHKLQLFNDTLPGFLDYNDMSLGYYDPYGILYKIISPDSLLMVHKGML